MRFAQQYKNTHIIYVYVLQFYTDMICLFSG